MGDQDPDMGGGTSIVDNEEEHNAILQEKGLFDKN